MNRLLSYAFVALLCALNAARSQTSAGVPLSLGDAVRLAARESGTAVAARYRAGQARGRAAESRSALLPHVSATWADGQRTFNTATFGIPLPGHDPNGEIIGPVRSIDFRGRVVANVFDAAAIGRYRGARAASDGAFVDARVAATQAGSAAAVAYVRVLRAQAQLSARAADSSLAAELLMIAQRQLDAGVGVALDVTRARAQLATTRAQLIAARNETDQSRLDLARVLGLSLDAPLTLRDTLSPTSTVPLSEAAMLARAHRDRPELRAATAAVETARRALAAAKAERLPTFGVFGDGGATSNSYSHLLNTYTYGVQLTVPVFEGFRTSARVQQQAAALNEAEARRRDVELQVGADVRGAILDLAASREQLEAARERLALGEQEVAQSRERFRAGVAGNADVIAAQLNLDAARSQYVDALAALTLSRIALARAQGHLLEIS